MGYTQRAARLAACVWLVCLLLGSSGCTPAVRITRGEHDGYQGSYLLSNDEVESAMAASPEAWALAIARSALCSMR